MDRRCMAQDGDSGLNDVDVIGTGLGRLIGVVLSPHLFSFFCVLVWAVAGGDAFLYFIPEKPSKIASACVDTVIHLYNLEQSLGWEWVLAVVGLYGLRPTSTSTRRGGGV